MSAPRDGSPPDGRESLYDHEITKLYEEFANQTYRCARRGLSHEDAEEIVNFSFLAARLHWERVRSYETPIAYVMKTACNLRADALAKATRHRPLSLNDLPEAAISSTATPPDSYHHEQLRAALTQLSPREEQMTVLYYWTGLPTKEIASVLGVRPGHVSRTLADARARLYRLLSAPDGDDGNGIRP